jgi:predicted Zn-dependent protease
MTNRRSVILAICVSLPLAAQAAKVDPAYEAEALPGEEDEAELWEGARSHEDNLRETDSLIDEPQVEAYIEEVAARMLGDSIDHLGIDIKFIVIREPVLSAFAYPYGTIGINTGLLVRMDNEAQFGAILAHELSHFLQRHTYLEMLDGDRQSTIGKGLGFLAGLAMAKQTGTFDPGVMGFAGNLWENLTTSGYSKKNEYVADEEGLQLMHRAGLQIDEALPAFEALAENAVYGAADPRMMWSSHPRLEDRIENLEKEVRRMKRDRDFTPNDAADSLSYFRGIAPVLMINSRLDISERQFGRAREALEKYVQVRPEDPEAYFLIGETHRRANPMGPEFDESQAAYRQALEHDPTYAPALKELGMTYRLQGHNTEAREAFEQYLTHGADAPDAGIIRGYLEGL